MASQTAEDALAEWNEAICDVGKGINRTNWLCETEHQHNTLAVLLLVKALDIIEAVHGIDAVSVVSNVIEDRERTRLAVPPTQEAMDQFLRLKDFLP